MVDEPNNAPVDVELTGCRPEPLASYLKALGVLRIVGEQKDPEARGRWRGEHFVLRSKLNREALVQFFLNEYRPTPVVAPWNGGSGFYPKDNRDAAEAILVSDDPRFSAFSSALREARAFVAKQGWLERPADDAKVVTISAMRAVLPDEALAWLDAAVVLTSDPKGADRLLFPPLLGTGGNDGRLDFSNNFQQRVVEVVSRKTPDTVASALFGTTMTSRFKGSMGQYLPAAGDRTNPWDFVLLIEGALLFAGAATRRWETSTHSVMAFPFHARAAGGLVTVTESDEDESRDELWLPLWSTCSSLREVRQLFAEGRATVGAGDLARPASSALDFARAVAALGVDRGIEGFSRVGFHVRNGLAYYATPLGRFSTQEVPGARLLDDVDAWYERFRVKASGKNVPASVAVAKRKLELAMFEAAERGELRGVLLALGDAEQALAQSLSFTTKAFLGPVPSLQSAWSRSVADGSVEQRLAAALASRPGMRSRLLPIDRSARGFGRGDEASYVFRPRALTDNLHALLLREDIEAQQGERLSVRDKARLRCSLTDLAGFIDERTDDVMIERWLRAFVLIDGLDLGPPPQDVVLPSATFAVLALVHHRRVGDVELARTAGALARACAGDAQGATEAAIRRLNASARPLPFRALVEPPRRARRIAAALAFPLTEVQRRKLESMVLPAIEEEPHATRDRLPEDSV